MRVGRPVRGACEGESCMFDRSMKTAAECDWRGWNVWLCFWGIGSISPRKRGWIPRKTSSGPPENRARTGACVRELKCLTHKDKGDMILGFSSVCSRRTSCAGACIFWPHGSKVLADSSVPMVKQASAGRYKLDCCEPLSAFAHRSPVAQALKQESAHDRTYW